MAAALLGSVGAGSSIADMQAMTAQAEATHQASMHMQMQMNNMNMEENAVGAFVNMSKTAGSNLKESAQRG
jgi:hypothetical protein